MLSRAPAESRVGPPQLMQMSLRFRVAGGESGSSERSMVSDAAGATAGGEDGGCGSVGGTAGGTGSMMGWGQGSMPRRRSCSTRGSAAK